ncbi:MAG: MazG-like family protein [Pseudomonadaceae bacterium]|nr:MazG-like family protein [Pseudomonadaceae bacterium]
MQTGKKPASYIPEWKRQEELKNKYNIEINSSSALSINHAVQKINNIYPANRHIWSTVGPVFHFSRILEELGEIHEAYTGFCKEEQPIGNVAEELADVLAWLLSAWGILTTSNLSDALITYYYENCPVCHEESCKCKDYASRGQRLVKIEELLEFKQKLEELIKLAPEKSTKLK